MVLYPFSTTNVNDYQRLPMIITYCKPECPETKIYAFYLKYFAKFLHRSTSLTQNSVEVSDTFLHFVQKIINLKEKTSKINLVSGGYFRN